MSTTVRAWAASKRKKKKKKRERCDTEGPVCLPRLWLTFEIAVLDDVTVDDSGAHQCCGASVPVSLERRRMSAAQYFCRALAAFHTFPPNTKKQTPALSPSLSLHRLSFTLLCETQQPWRSWTTVRPDCTTGRISASASSMDTRRTQVKLQCWLNFIYPLFSFWSEIIRRKKLQKY